MNSKLLVLLLVFCLVHQSQQWWKKKGGFLKKVGGFFIKGAKVASMLGFGKKDLDALRAKNEALRDASDEELLELIQLAAEENNPDLQ